MYEKDKLRMLCGIDEAGRGPIAGPLVMAGVILNEAVEGLADSKTLSPKKREALYERIVGCSRYHIVVIGSETIDRDGISACLGYGLYQISSGMGGGAVSFLFDGNSAYGVPEIATMIKADSIVDEVKAASIVAKVARDRIMLEYASMFPRYGFEKHKGYGTAAHLEAVRRFGLSPIHRKSFKIKGI